MFYSKNKGFTLIELLVVVSIIAMLTSIVLSALSDARAKARDARRLQDIRTLLTAINMYMNDNGGNLPQSVSGAINSTQDDFLSPLINKYLPQKLTDPLNTTSYAYFYNTATIINSTFCSGQNAKALIRFKLEKMNSPYSKCTYSGYTDWSCICITNNN